MWIRGTAVWPGGARIGKIRARVNEESSRPIDHLPATQRREWNGVICLRRQRVFDERIYESPRLMCAFHRKAASDAANDF